MPVVFKHRFSFIEEKVLRNLSELVKKNIPEVTQIIVFGSRARGRSDENSDLDVAIIVNVINIEKKLWERLWDIKWDVLESLGAEELPLSLILITRNDFELRDFGLEKQIKEEGIIIWERGN